MKRRSRLYFRNKPGLIRYGSIYGKDLIEWQQYILYFHLLKYSKYSLN